MLLCQMSSMSSQSHPATSSLKAESLVYNCAKVLSHLGFVYLVLSSRQLLVALDSFPDVLKVQRFLWTFAVFFFCFFFLPFTHFSS